MWLSSNRPQLVTIRMRVGSLASCSGLRIWHCGELWGRSHMWLRSGVVVAVAVAVADSSSSDSTPSPRTSICCKCDPKKKKRKKKKRKKEKERATWRLISEWLPVALISLCDTEPLSTLSTHPGPHQFLHRPPTWAHIIAAKSVTQATVHYPGGTVTFILKDHCLLDHRVLGPLNILSASSLLVSGNQPLSDWVYSFCLGVLIICSEDSITNYSAECTPRSWVASQLFVCFCICCYQTMYIRRCTGEPINGAL